MPADLMENPAKSEIATCPTCGTLIDVAEQEPYSKIHCSSCGTWMRVRQHFANYEITGILGEGGQGLVYRAVDRKLTRNVAIKLMKRQYSADPLFVKRFESEAKVTASLNHPNVVKVFSFGEDRGLLYLAMELVDHGSLDSLIAQITKVPEDRVLEVGSQIAKGLQAGLEKGLIHRDIKPGNILFADEHTAKIVDFGLAVLVEKQHEEEGDVWATPYYVAPEKLDGRPEDFRSDMYSLAATLFHALAGRPPFIAETSSMAELKKIKSKPVHLLSYAPHVSQATAYVIDKALATKPEDRWASYGEFIENLEYARSELRKQGAKVRRPRTVSPVGGGSGGMLVYALIAIIVGMGFYIYYSKTKPGTQPAPLANGTPAPALKMTIQEAEARYNAAREKLADGEFRAAAAGFRELNSEGVLTEPRFSWSGVHEALAELLDGRLTQARRALRDITQKITPGAIGMDDAFAGFLRELARAMRNDEPTPPAEAAKFKRDNYEAIALLILGLRNWELGAHSDAIALLREFSAAKPAGDSTWVGEYRTLISRYLSDYSAYRAAMDDLRGHETDPLKAEAALKALDDTKAKIKTSGLIAKLSETARELEPTIMEANAAVRAEMERKNAAMLAAEEQKLTETKLRVKTMSENYQFAEAMNLLNALDLKAPAHVKDRDLLRQRVEWLVQFKEQLMRDLTGGYAGPLQRKNGQQLPGGVLRATEHQLEIRIGSGSAIIPWAEITAQSVLTMARAFVRPGITPEAAADRRWRAGVFAIFTQLYAESEVLMAQAAEVKDEYRIHKALFFGEPEPEPEPEAQPASQPPMQNEAPGTGLEMSNEALNPSRKPLDEAVIKSLRPPQQ